MASRDHGIECERYTMHMCLSVRGALDWDKRKLRNGTKWIKRKDGSTYTPVELRNALMDELAQGHEVIPMGDCDNFDFKRGCLGHNADGSPRNHPRLGADGGER